MEQKDMIINGVSINGLIDQREAIREGASKIISDNIDIAEELTEKLLESQDLEEIQTLAQQAYKALSIAETLSEVSGVTFYLEYEEDSTRKISNLLDDSNNALISGNWNGIISDLYHLYYNMEKQTQKWNASFC